MFTLQFIRATGTTHEASNQAISLLQAPGLRAAYFSASPRTENRDTTPADGNSTNWPYLFVVIRVDDDVHVFDSVNMNAQRIPRDREVRDLLDAAQASGKAYFTADDQAFFTAGLTPQQAAMTLDKRPLTPLKPETRADLWWKLSTLSEAELDRQRLAPVI